VRKKTHKIVIDVATIYPGHGGAGGGIWSYSANLLIEMDRVLQDPQNGQPELICLVNSSFNLPLKNIRIKRISWNLQNFLFRFIYVHIYLPLYCIIKKAALHKTYFEAPFFHFTAILVTIHDCMPDFYASRGYFSRKPGGGMKTWYFRLMSKRAINRSKTILTPSQAVKDEIVRNYQVKENKIIVTPLAAQFREVQIPERPASGTINIYCIAAFHRHKGHMKLLDIFELLISNYHINAKLFFRGHVHDNVYYNEVIQRINRSPVKKRIEIVQYQQGAGLADIYKNTDWVILLSEYEGFGLPVIEAQAFSKPIICSDIPVFREVAGSSAAFLPTEITADQAALQLFQILTDERAKQEMIKKGHANTKRYSWEKFGKQMEHIYIRCLNE
jgi:glycosyltransferase involved in cell wall biosynthesis